MRIQNMPIMRLFLLSFTVGLSSITSRAAATESEDCTAFIDPKATEPRNPVLQARCLLRPVLRFGEPGPELEALPPTLGRLLGQAFDLTTIQARTALEATGVHAEDAATAEQAITRGGQQGSVGVRYFVIHDTGAPALRTLPFPADLDANPVINNLSGPALSGVVAHAVVSRDGNVVLAGFDGTIAESAFERADEGSALGLFLHVQLVQPRRRHPAMGPGDSSIAPTPGFTRLQYQRLAQLYILASTRARRWLIPALHANLDRQQQGGVADDPQHFQLAEFDQALGEILSLRNDPPPRIALRDPVSSPPVIEPDRGPQDPDVEPRVEFLELDPALPALPAVQRRIAVRADWDGRPDGNIWTELALRHLREFGQALLVAVPEDIEEFCPQFRSLDAAGREAFWVGLISAMTRFESNFRPEVAFNEYEHCRDQRCRDRMTTSDGRPVISRGLLQLSQESANGYVGCPVPRQDELRLHEADLNLRCTVAILNRRVVRDRVINAQRDGSWVGGAAYWSVLRPGSSLTSILRYTNRLAICAA